jgi:hypothetical protein
MKFGSLTPLRASPVASEDVEEVRKLIDLVHFVPLT